MVELDPTNPEYLEVERIIYKTFGPSLICLMHRIVSVSETCQVFCCFCWNKCIHSATKEASVACFAIFMPDELAEQRTVNRCEICRTNGLLQIS